MRKHLGHGARLTVVLLLGLVLVRCTGSGGSPTTPSNPTPTGSSPGATVQGLVTGSGEQGASGASFAPDATVSGTVIVNVSAFTVEVVGTDLSAVVGPDGRFTITGVPETSSLILHIVGPNVDVQIDLGPLGADDTLEVRLRVDDDDVIVQGVGLNGDFPDDLSADDESHDDSSDDPSSDDDADDASEDESDDKSDDDPSDDDSDDASDDASDDESDDDSNDDSSDDSKGSDG